MTNIPEIELSRDEITGELIPEIWKDIQDYEGLYQVSNYGRVKSLARSYLHGLNHRSKTILEERLKNQPVDTQGYFMLILSKGGKKKTRRIHQLVAEAFLDHTPNGFELVVNHKDLDKLNNRVKNLEVVTNRKNSDQKHIKSTSEFVGVSQSQGRKKWRAYIYINRKNISLGSFKTEIEASEAYQKALAKHLSENDNNLIEK